MSDVLTLHGLGCSVEVRCSGDAAAPLLEALRAAWSRCLVADGRVEPRAANPVEARLDDEGDLAHRLMATTQTVTRALIAAQAGHLLMVHAGAVSHPLTGVSLVYVAPGGTGKTTLSRRLGQSYGYLTDETVGMDVDGRILPYPKPLSVRRQEQPGVKDELSPDALGLLAAPPAPVASRVVLLARDPAATAADVEEVPFMDAVFALTEQSSSLAALPRPRHRMADFIDAAGPVLRLRYAEAADLDGTVTALLGGAA